MMKYGYSKPAPTLLHARMQGCVNASVLLPSNIATLATK
jgi:hypothetical protein